MTTRPALLSVSCIALCSLIVACAAPPAGASDFDEFKIKRAEVFEFAEKPQAAVEGDQVTITFASKANCDATVVIEDASGQIIRHLASGVLGPQAPAPFQRDSLSQTVVWDGKDDRGRYVDDKSSCTVRVSLGLKPQFERTLFWEPKLRVGREAPPMVATPEGVYVYDGRVLDYVRLYDHAGNYVRTVYPFPSDKIDEVQGLHRRVLPQSGKLLPMREGFHQSTFLSCGTNSGFLEDLGFGTDRYNNWHGSVSGNAASTMAVRNGRLALARKTLNRLATDGSSGGLVLHGPPVTFDVPARGNWDRDNLGASPQSAAFSPDDKWLYLTGYVRAQGTTATKDIVLINSYDWIPVVARVDFENGSGVEVFLGGPKLSDAGNAPGKFRMPTSVTVDDAGRIYICDYGNDRIQVFSPDGQHLKSIETPAPVQVEIHPKTAELYVFSWYVPDDSGGKSRENAPRFQVRGASGRQTRREAVSSALTILESFDNPTPRLVCELPLPPVPGRGLGYPSRVALDSWADPPVVWVASEWGFQDFLTTKGGTKLDRIASYNIRLLRLEEDGLKPLRDFSSDVAKSVVRQRAPEYFRQRLYVNPKTGDLYVGEGQAAVGKSFKDLIRIDPNTGRVSMVELPYDAEDMAFGPDGAAYLRTFYFITRHDPARNWMEVPFDYGEEKDSLHTSSSSDRRETSVASAIRLPVKNAGLHHHGGMGVSPKGNLVVAVNNYAEARLLATTRRDAYDNYAEGSVKDDGKAYTPRLFPGRLRFGEVHVYDPHGRMLIEDAVPGLTNLDGIELDRDDNLYFLSTATRILNGQQYFNENTSTLIKVAPRQAKMISSSEKAAVPLPDELKPDRAPDLVGGFAGKSWFEGAHWFYGGAGFAGKNASRVGGGCNCYNSRFALDCLARSFVPEFDHYTVAVLDSAGNLILRIGRYGNADDGMPLVKDGASPAARSIGGDEVALFYAPYVATHTDRRLFIADPGNGRVLSVKLGYHAEERVPLRPAVGNGNPEAN